MVNLNIQRNIQMILNNLNSNKYYQIIYVITTTTTIIIIQKNKLIIYLKNLIMRNMLQIHNAFAMAAINMAIKNQDSTITNNYKKI